MPDLKTALSNVLNEWSKDDGSNRTSTPSGTKLFTPTNNVTRATFDEIRNHPAKRIVILNRLKSEGYKPNSVSSIITQMLRQGMVTVGGDGRLHTTIAEYVPLKPWKHRGAVQTKPKIVLRKKEAKPVQEERKEPQRPMSVSSPVWSVDDVLTQLNILEARAVYDALHKIFGGAK